MMRIHTANQSSSNEGYVDVLIGGGGLNVATEVTPDYFANNASWKNLGMPVVTEQWMAVEQYVKLSSVPGQAIYRVWQDGQLIKEDLQTKTLRSSSSMSDFAYLFSYWNGSAPKTQVAYVDDVYITNETPGALDAAGNAFIGLTDSPPSGTGGGGSTSGGNNSGGGDGTSIGGGGSSNDGAGGSGMGGASNAGGDNGATDEGSAGGSCTVGSAPASTPTPWLSLLLAGGPAALRRRPARR